MTNFTDDSPIVDVVEQATPVDITASDPLVIIDSAQPSIDVTEQLVTSTVFTEGDLVIVFESGSATEIVEIGAAGPQGIQGESGGSTEMVTKIAAVSVGGHRVVILNAADQVEYADSHTIAHRDVVYGITTGAASIGSPAQIQRSGELVEPSWTWTPQLPVFLSVTGLLTQTAPASPAVFSRIVAFAVTATKIVIGLREPLTLA